MAQDVVFGVVQQRKELAEIAGLAFGGELVVEAPHAAAHDSPPVVHILSGGHPASYQLKLLHLDQRNADEGVPEGNSIIVWTYRRHNALVAMSRDDVPNNVTMKLPFVFF